MLAEGGAEPAARIPALADDAPPAASADVIPLDAARRRGGTGGGTAAGGGTTA